WAGWEGARKLGALALSGGGQSTAQRLRAIVDCGATILVCTPTYALHMAAEAKKLDIDLPRQVPIRASIHAGEPGASIPSTKKRIEEAWGGRCFDHPGATEVGAFGFECELQPGGVHVNEREFIAEVVDPKTGKPVVDDAEGELVMTNLGRIGSPVIRYRTGDVVRPSHEPCPCGRPYLFLRGGVLGRVDDMVVIRGVNVYPSAIERIVRQIQEIDEFRIEAVQTPGLTELKITAEPRPGCVTVTAIGAELSERIRSALGVRPVVEIVSPGALPRFELKARRFFKSARS
ncbi:MAG TPA: phenylacetate--CoA ligase family protein, partial [Candidatus Eisenbacteria bacterium]|nr:phenylacetate--CoA ligase family protein [Candidatus Eisenbacteria bacterium]